MSFTSEIKNETSMLNLTQSEKIAELSAFIRSNGKIFDDYIISLFYNFLPYNIERLKK